MEITLPGVQFHRRMSSPFGDLKSANLVLGPEAIDALLHGVDKYNTKKSRRWLWGQFTA